MIMNTTYLSLTIIYVQTLKTQHLMCAVLCVTGLGCVLLLIRTVVQVFTPPEQVSDSEDPSSISVRYCKHGVLHLILNFFLVFSPAIYVKSTRCGAAMMLVLLLSTLTSWSSSTWACSKCWGLFSLSRRGRSKFVHSMTPSSWLLWSTSPALFWWSLCSLCSF